MLTRLRGEEREVACQLILDNLKTHAEWLFRAATILEIDEAIPYLKETVRTTDDIFLKVWIARWLFDWIGFPEFAELLDHTMDVITSEWLRCDCVLYALVLERADAHRMIIKGLRDRNICVRSAAYEALVSFMKDHGLKAKLRRPLPEMQKWSNEKVKDYYINEDVYNNKDVFEERLSMLRERIA